MFICKTFYKACKRIVRGINLSCLNKVLRFWYHDQFSGFGYLKYGFGYLFEIQMVRKSDCITFSKTEVLVE